MLIYGHRIIHNIHLAYSTIPLLESTAGVEEVVEEAKADVGGGAGPAEGVEGTAADQDEFGDTESGGAKSKNADVVPLGYVVQHHVGL